MNVYPKSGLPCLQARNPDGHLGPLARRAADQDDTTDGSGSLAHGVQAQVTREGFPRVEASAVVAHTQRELARSGLKRDDDRPGAGVLCNVVERLLSNPVQRLFDCWRRLRL